MRFYIRKSRLAAGLVLGLNAMTAQATLFDRGGGLLYDDVLNVTWLQDANYAKTSSYDEDGLMNWYEAIAWAGNLVYHDSVRNVDYSDWRLPTISDTGTPGCNWSNSGTDCGYNVDTANSEMAHMYFNNLGLKSELSASGIVQPDFGVFGNGTFDGVVTSTTAFGQKDVGPVMNLQALQYWTGTQYWDYEGHAWIFITSVGSQTYYLKGPQVGFPFDVAGFSWAVRDGDVAAVPLPGAVWLMGTGVIGLLSLKRRGQAG